MREFGAKYEGNIQLALRGYQKERLAAAGADTSLGEIDKSMRKRKWVASQETDTEASESSQPKDTDSQRVLKNGRSYTLLLHIYSAQYDQSSSDATSLTSESSRVFHWSWNSATLPTAK